MLWVAIVKADLQNPFSYKNLPLSCESIRLFKADSLPKKHGEHHVLILNYGFFFLSVISHYTILSYKYQPFKTACDTKEVAKCSQAFHCSCTVNISLASPTFFLF